MKTDRLLSIMSMLQAKGRATARELAEQMEVSERTIHRDMESLAMAGFPVYAGRGYRGGWSLPEGYRSRLTGLTSDEINSLLLLGSSSVVTDLGLAGSAQVALRKLLSALPASVRHDAEVARQRIHIDGAGWHAPGGTSSDPSLLAAVQQAVWEERKLRIHYRAMDAESAKERIVSPLGLVAKMSVWYLVAAADDDIRTYRVSRISGAEPLNETFGRPASFDLAAHWEKSTERFQSALPRYPATVFIAASRWPRFSRERYAYIQHEKPPEEGWIEAQVDFHTLESACGILMSYGRFAEAIEPAELRQAIRDELQAAADRYAPEDVADVSDG